MQNDYLIWLNWPIASFRVGARALRVFRSIVKGRGRVTCVRSERAFRVVLPRATHVLCWEFKKAWFAKAPRLRVLATPGAGRELLPKDDELPPGVRRVNGAFHGHIMSETVLAFMFAHARGLYAADAYQRAGNLWPRAALSPSCFRVAGTHAVILGYGHIGRILGAKLEALGVCVTGIRRANFADLMPACRTADWLIVALPSDTGTDRLVNAAVLRALPRRAVLINVGRGNAVDEPALVQALSAHGLAAAFLDVYAHEPLAAGDPLAADFPGLHRFPHATAFAGDYMETWFRELESSGDLL